MYVTGGTGGPVYFDTAVFVFVTSVVVGVVVRVVAWSIGLPIFFLNGGDVTLVVVFLVGAVFIRAKVNSM
jgi:hypothetical protein